MSKRPPTLDEAQRRRLVCEPPHAIHTFSNGTDWECWADSNCVAPCWYWDPDCAGGRCAFEGAALLNMVSPELARLFGWVQRTTEYGPLSGWDPPDRCPFFRPSHDDDGNDNPPPPDPDPDQFVLIADPTEDAAVIPTGAPDLVEVGA